MRAASLGGCMLRGGAAGDAGAAPHSNVILVKDKVSTRRLLGRYAREAM